MWTPSRSPRARATPRTDVRTHVQGPAGRHPLLPGLRVSRQSIQRCEENIDGLIRTWSRRDLPLVVIRHDSEVAGSPFMPGHSGNALVDDVAAINPDLGFSVTVPPDATRTFDLEDPEGNVIPAGTLMQVTAANLQSGGFARVTSTGVLVEAVNRDCG